MTTTPTAPLTLEAAPEIAAIREALDAGPTPGPWIIATSNSWRRIVTAHRMESVCEPITQNDGHPDLYFRNGGASGPDARLIEACNPAAMTAVLATIAQLEARLRQTREALAVAVDHIEMDALRISHCKDAEAIDAAIAAHGKDEA